MKKILICIFSMCLLQACSDKKICDDNCRKETTGSTLPGRGIVVSDTSKALSCKLTSEELQKRKTDVLAIIKGKILERKELSDGYSFKFENTDEMIDMLADFIKSERQCCDFFNFSINVKNDGDLWFDLTGPKDAKEMIGQELGL